MRNNIIGFLTYLMVTILFNQSVSFLILFIKENSDRCHYYNGKWNKKDLILAIVNQGGQVSSITISRAMEQERPNFRM